MGMSGIYQIRNILNGRVYIGSAINLSRRNVDHFKGLRGGYHGNRYLQRAWVKYGEESFRFEILEMVDKSEMLLDAEQRHLDVAFAKTELSPYNICRQAGSQLGTRRTPETKRKMALLKLGGKHTSEHRAKMSAAMKGRIRTAEHQEKLNMARTGFRHTEEAKAKIRQNRKGRGLHDEAWRSHMSAIMTGRKMPEGHGERLREAHRSLTKEQVADIVARRKAGETYVDIAKDYGTTKDTIRNWCLREGGQNYDRVMPEALRKEIFERRLAGESLRDICKKCRVGKLTVIKVYEEGLASMETVGVPADRPAPEPLALQPEQISLL